MERIFFLYKEKITWMEFNKKNIPDWLSVKQNIRFKKYLILK